LIKLYDSKETNFNNNGLRVLSDCISCKTKEELNGLYELKLGYPIDDQGKWEHLVEDNIIKNSKGQLFRIYYKEKTDNGMGVTARHIYYDLLDNLVNKVDIRGLSCVAALNKIMANTLDPHNFTVVCDISTVNTIAADDKAGDIINKNVVEAINILIGIYGGELVRDNFNISLLGQRGASRGVLVSYGKNIEEIKENLDLDGVCTRGKFVGKDGIEVFIESQYINNYSHPKNKVINFNDIDTLGALTAAGQKYFEDSKCDIPEFNYVISMILLSDTEEYKNFAVLERVFLADEIIIRHTKINIDLKAKIISIILDDLTGKIEKVECGSFKPNIATSINNSINEVKKEIVQVKSDYQIAIENATSLITGSKGGNVVIRQDNAGKPYEILIMDTTDVNTCLKCWRWNLGGFGYSNTGVNGPFEVAITMDGTIMGKFITALIITGEQINGGTISGATIRTSNTSNYMLLHDQVLDLYKNNALNMRIGIDTYGADEYPFIAFGRGLDEPFNMQNYIWYADDDGTQETGYITIRAGKQTNLFSGGDVTINANNEIGIVAPLIRLSGETQITAPGGSGWFVDPWPAHACAIKTTGDVGIGGKLSATEGFKNLGKVFGAAWDCTIPDNTGVNLTHNLGYQPIITCSGTCGNIGLTFLDVDLNTIRVWVANNAGNAWVGRVSCW